jgi:hypothetical protein
MKLVKVFTAIIFLISLSLCVDFVRLHRELRADTKYEWTREDFQPNTFYSVSNFKDFAWRELRTFGFQAKKLLLSFRKFSDYGEEIRIYIPGEEEVRFIKDQKKRYNISVYKSQILEKSKYSAFYIDEASDTSKVSMTNVGMNGDHYSPTGWPSFRIKFGKTNNPFGRKSKKSILRSSTRSNGIDFFANNLFYDLCGGIKVNSYPINLFINGQEQEDFLIEDSWDKYLIEANRRREGSIFEVGFNGVIRSSNIVRDSLFISINNEIDSEKERILEFAGAMNQGSPNLDLIDEEKLEVLLLLCKDFFGGHPLLDINLHWYHNPVSNLFEPTIREVGTKEDYGEVFLDTTEFFPAYYINKRKINFESLRKKWFSKYNPEITQYISSVFPEIERSRIYEINNSFNGYKVDLDSTAIVHSYDTLRFSSKQIISEDLLINKSQILFIEDGTELIFINSANLKVFGGIILNGQDKRIRIKAFGDNSIFVSAKEMCKITNSDFFGFSNLLDSIEYHYLPSAITFYETKVEIKNCTFNDNIRGDDYVNFFRCPAVSLSGCLFDNVLADAIDSDFSVLNINYCQFTRVGNDGVDVSGSELYLSNSSFRDVYDKAVSGGEASLINVDSCSFVRNEIALVSKDGSILNFSNCSFNENKLDVSAFQKKLEYRQSEIYSKDTMDLSFLIEERVKTNIQVEVVRDVKKKMYGREFGRATKK